MINLQNYKVTVGTANNQIIEDVVKGSNGTAVATKFNALIDQLETVLNSTLSYQVVYQHISTTNTTISNTASLIGVDSNQSIIQINLPTAVRGRIFTVKDEGGRAATNNIRIGPLPFLIAVNGGSIRLYYDGSTWRQI